MQGESDAHRDSIPIMAFTLSVKLSAARDNSSASAADAFFLAGAILQASSETMKDALNIG
jgi:hypothetical protein